MTNTREYDTIQKISYEKEEFYKTWRNNHKANIKGENKK